MMHAPTLRRSAFTLTELLIVMGVIGALSVLTLVSVRAVARDARLSSATNTVTASLDSARAMAMKHNTVVVVVFRPRFDGNARIEQVVDVVIAKWTGDTLVDMAGGTFLTADRFAPMFDVPVRSMPKGIKVAGPSYGNTDYAANADFVWATQTHLPGVDPDNLTSSSNEVFGSIIGVLYAPDGTTISINPRTDADGFFVDFNNDGGQDLANPDPDQLLVQLVADDEPMVQVVPFLAVYDDDEARKLKTGDWRETDPTIYRRDLIGDPDDPELYPGYITTKANRIHFNRYSGVVMR